VLVWSRASRAAVWTAGGLLIGVVYGAPILIIALASFAGHWNSVWPSDFTFRHYMQAFQGASAEQLRASFMTGLTASALALASGTWAALALRNVVRLPRRVLDLLFFVPSAVPSVTVGLGLLVAFSRPPLLLNGTTAIVLIAHFVLISAFTYAACRRGWRAFRPIMSRSRKASARARPTS
jgi:2-aminoethylphosphonate transport system permease protein